MRFKDNNKYGFAAWGTKRGKKVFIYDNIDMDTYEVITLNRNTLVLRGSGQWTCCDPEISYYSNGYLEFSSFKKIKMSAMFMMYRLMTRKTDFSIGGLINGSTVSKVPREVVKAYSAPFPDKSYKAGASAWPSLVPLFSWSKDTALG